MKSVIVIAALLALGTGCAANAPTKTARNTTPISELAPVDADDDMVVMPAMDSSPEGSMSVSWAPKAPPAAKKVRPRRLDAKPQALRKKRRLYALPTN
jgi:hypothetical protein